MTHQIIENCRERSCGKGCPKGFYLVVTNPVFETPIVGWEEYERRMKEIGYKNFCDYTTVAHRCECSKKVIAMQEADSDDKSGGFRRTKK